MTDTFESNYDESTVCYEQTPFLFH